MFCSRKIDVAKRLSKELDSFIKADAKKRSSIIQLLLLGTGESGKTTIIKQMKVIHINGFSDHEKREKIPNIHQNIHESIYDIVSHMDKLTPPLTLVNESSKKSAEYIFEIGPTEPESYAEEYFGHVKNLWDDPEVKETVNHSNEFQLIDSATHFLERLDDIRRSDYIPTIQDMLFCRVKTVAISKIEFTVPVPSRYGGGKQEFWMYDVGGQRGERKKWIALFEGIHAILFLIAASDFDLALREDENKNRLKEAFQVFEDIFWSRFVRNAGKIVFLNKQDLLEKKIRNGKRIDKYFPEYKNYILPEKLGNSKDEYDRTKYFIRQKITDIADKSQMQSLGILPGLNIHEEIKKQDIYIHFTVATDTSNIKKVFDSVHDMILTANLTASGLIY